MHEPQIDANIPEFYLYGKKQKFHKVWKNHI